MCVLYTPCTSRYDHYADEIVEEEKEVQFVSESISDGSERRRLLISIFKVEELVTNTYSHVISHYIFT